VSATASVAATAPSASTPAAEADVDIPPVARPKSAWTVDGVSLSDIDGLAIAGAFKKAKLTDSGSAGSSPGNGWDTVNVSIAKGKMKGMFYLVRPATFPTKKTSTGGPNVAESLLDKEKGFGIWDKEADVYFKITLDEGGKAADAKRMLEQVIKKK
jgi:hypothetical protein